MRIYPLLTILPLLLIASPAFASDDLLFDFSKDTGSISIDASVFHTATPDVVNASVICEIRTPGSREQIQRNAQKIVASFKQSAGAGSRIIRKLDTYQDYSAPPSDSEPVPTRYTGSLNISLPNLAPTAVVPVQEESEKNGCTINWDVRLFDTSKYVLEYKDELMKQLRAKKHAYEVIMGQSLTRSSGFSFTTYIDGGYSSGSYDPDTNTVNATTTLYFTLVTGPIPK